MATGLGERKIESKADLERDGIDLAIPAQETQYEKRPLRSNQIMGPVCSTLRLMQFLDSKTELQS